MSAYEGENEIERDGERERETSRKRTNDRMSEKYKNYYVLECMHVMLYLQCLTHTREISSVPRSTYDFYYYRQMLVYNHRVCRVLVFSMLLLMLLHIFVLMMLRSPKQALYRFLLHTDNDDDNDNYTGTQQQTHTNICTHTHTLCYVKRPKHENLLNRKYIHAFSISSTYTVFYIQCTGRAFFPSLIFRSVSCSLLLLLLLRLLFSLISFFSSTEHRYKNAMREGKKFVEMRKSSSAVRVPLTQLTSQSASQPECYTQLFKNEMETERHEKLEKLLQRKNACVFSTENKLERERKPNEKKKQTKFV